MSERKNIDKLFQEKFKHFEATPAEEVWHTIEAKLNEKKKRRIIPFWWKFSGVAAIVLLGLLLYKSVLRSEWNGKNSVVIETTTEKTESKQTTKSPENNSQNIPFIPNSKTGKTTTNAIVDQQNNAHEKQSVSTPEEPYKMTLSSHTPQRNVAQLKTAITPSLKNKENSNPLKQVVNKSLAEEQVNQIATSETTSKNTPALNKSMPLRENNSTVDKTTVTQKSIDLSILKDSDNSNSKIVTPEKNVNDTTQIAGVTTNALEELLNEKESKEKQQSKENRWQITSAIAPVFLGSVSNGSSIDPMFKNNDKQYNTNISVGVGITYAINNTISLRTGINKMAVDYNTNDIAFYADLENTGFSTINPSKNGQMIHVENISSNPSVPMENNGLLPFESTFFHKNEGYINQKMGYYEVPVELTYAIINKRFGVKIISGISTFFLDQNSISVVSDNISVDLGQANNLNDIHFSTNLGLGIKYGFFKSFEINIEPTVKYQWNTFSSNAGSFKPYIVGVYSGISYKF